MTPIKVYLASSYSTIQIVRGWAYILDKEDIEVTSRWIRAGHQDGYDPRKCAEEDLEDVDNSDILVAFTPPDNPSDSVQVHTSPDLPSSGGRYVELGYAIAKNKGVIVAGKRENIFYWHPSVHHVPQPLTEEGLINRIKQVHKSIKGL